MSYFRVPMALIKDDKYKKISNEAKLLYCLMLDRKGLSKRNNWRDNRGIYINYAQSEASKDLCCCLETVAKATKELESVGLITRKKLGLGRPCRIYVLDFPQDKSDVCMSDLSMSDNEIIDDCTTVMPMPVQSFNRYQEADNIDANQPYPIHPDNSHLYSNQSYLCSVGEIKDEIREQISYDFFAQSAPSRLPIVDTIVDIIAEAERSASATLHVGGAELQKDDVISVLHTIDYTHVDYVLDCLDESRPNIRNIRAYLLTALFNAPDTMEAYYSAKVAHDYPDL